MKPNYEKHKTVEESKTVCLQTRERKKSMLQSLYKFAEIMESETLLKELPEEINIAKTSIEKSTQEFAKLQPLVQKQTVCNERLKEEVDAQEKKLLSMKSIIEQLKSKTEKYEKKNRELDTLKKRLSELEIEKNSTDSRIKELSHDVELLKNETSSMQAKLTTDKKELNKLEPEKQQLTMNIEALLKKITELDEVKINEDELIRLNVENKEIADKIMEFKQSIADDMCLNKEITSYIQNVNEKITETTCDVEDMSQRTKSLRQTVITKDEADKLQIQLNTVRKEKSDTKKKIKKIEHEIKKHLKTKGGIIKEVEDTRAEFEAMAKDYNKYKKNIESYEKNHELLERLRDEITDLNKERDEHRKKAYTAQARLTHINNTADIINSKLRGYKNAMEQINGLLSVYN